jgi:hypothetical protein|tara:strand:+ start:146 stop:361 length:216 start_codon:yes stop_codon:yes gene_type:complete
MGNILSKIADMEEDGTLPKFDPNYYVDVLNLARKKGLRSEVMYSAMDIIRDNPTLTNEEAIMLSAKKWNLV